MPAYVLSSNVTDCTYCKGTSVSLSDCFKLMITHTASSHLVWLPGSNKYPIRLYTMHINHSEEKKHSTCRCQKSQAVSHVMDEVCMKTNRYGAKQLNLTDR